MRGKLMPNTIAVYNYVGKRFCNFAAGQPIGPTLLKNWMLYIQEVKSKKGGYKNSLSASKINGINIRVRSFVGWLHRFGYLSQDYSDLIPAIMEPVQKRSEVFTEQEYQQIKKWCSGRLWCQPHLWLLILAYRTGMSLVDCCYLRWRDVHLNHDGPSFIDIYRIKTQRLGEKALCQIPIVPNTDVHQWLMFLKKAEPQNYKRFDGITDFVHQDCPGLYECSFQRIGQDFKDIFKRSGVRPGRTFRHMRNSFISNLVNSDVQMGLIMKMTGHKNAETLLIYLKADRRALQDGLAKSFNYAATQAGTGLDASGVGGDYGEDE
jgi:integrase